MCFDFREMSVMGALTVRYRIFDLIEMYVIGVLTVEKCPLKVF